MEEEGLVRCGAPSASRCNPSYSSGDKPMIRFLRFNAMRLVANWFGHSLFGPTADFRCYKSVRDGAQTPCRHAQTYHRHPQTCPRHLADTLQIPPGILQTGYRYLADGLIRAGMRGILRFSGCRRRFVGSIRPNARVDTPQFPHLGGHKCPNPTLSPLHHPQTAAGGSRCTPKLFFVPGLLVENHGA